MALKAVFQTPTLSPNNKMTTFKTAASTISNLQNLVKDSLTDRRLSLTSGFGTGLAGALAGGLTGYATAGEEEDEGKTRRKKIQRALLGGAAGFGAASLLGRGLEGYGNIKSDYKDRLERAAQDMQERFVDRKTIIKADGINRANGKIVDGELTGLNELGHADSSGWIQDSSLSDARERVLFNRTAPGDPTNNLLRDIHGREKRRFDKVDGERKHFAKAYSKQRDIADEQVEHFRKNWTPLSQALGTTDSSVLDKVLENTEKSNDDYVRSLNTYDEYITNADNRLQKYKSWGVNPDGFGVRQSLIK